METYPRTWADRAADLTGADLRVRRKELGLSLSGLSDITSVSKNTLARWEREEMRIGHPPLISLALDGIEARIRGLL